MLGTVKMEGHESSDWNSYYADTQEVRGGNQVGHWEPVPEEAARGGRWARWAADGLGAPPQCPRCAPTWCGPGRALTGPRSGSAAPRGRPSLGAGVERAKGVQEILAFESTRSRKHLPLPYGEPEPGSGCRGLAGGRAMARVGGYSGKLEFAYKGGLFILRLNSRHLRKAGGR